MTRTLSITNHPSHRGRYLLESELLLPQDRQSVFAFFSDALQLETITPPWLRFQVLTDPPIAMRAGTLIDYKLRLHGIPVKWQSEIAVWEPPARFVDRQIIGPYKLWWHEHTFEEHPKGTLVVDRVEYAVPGGWLMNRVFVRRDLERIFRFRQEKMIEIFTNTSALSSVWPTKGQ